MGGFFTRRIHKGNSLLVPVSDYVVIDTETTGYDPNYDSIIELGAVKYINKKPVSEFSSLVNPGFDIDSFVIEKTGITNSELRLAPSLPEVLPKFLDFIGNSVVIGHNVNFDINFIYDATQNHNLAFFSNDFIDTLRFSRLLFKEYQNHRLEDLAERFKIKKYRMHRALSDCFATADCYTYMVNYMEQSSIDLTKRKKKHKSHSQKWKASDIIATVNDFDPEHPLYGKYCVFTGTLQKNTRREAMQIVVNFGGICEDRITKKTNLLILGNNDYCKSIKEGKSNKQRKAEEYLLSGQDIEIISENVFYDLIDSL